MIASLVLYRSVRMASRPLTPNWSVDSDTLRQGAAQCRWKSCTVRPLAATCRSPLRYASRPGEIAGCFGKSVGSLVTRALLRPFAVRAETPRALPASRTRADLDSVFAQAPSRAGRPDLALRSAVRYQACLFGPRALPEHRTLRRSCASIKSPRPSPAHWHNKAVDTDVLAARCRVPMARRSLLRYASRPGEISSCFGNAWGRW